MSEPRECDVGFPTSKLFMVENVRMIEKSAFDDLVLKNINLMERLNERITQCSVLMSQRDEARAELAEACAARDQWRKTHLECERLTKERVELEAAYTCAIVDRDEALRTKQHTIPNYPYVALTDYEALAARSAKLASALRSLVGFEPFNCLEPRRASEALAEYEEDTEKEDGE